MNKEKIIKVLEFLSQYSQGNCCLCNAKDYPVKGKLKGYEEVEPYEAEEWNTDHYDDCPVKMLENKSKESKKIKETIGLLNSMILCGEKHSEISRNSVKESLGILNNG